MFTRLGGKPFDDKELRCLLREHGIAAVPHVVQNRVEAAYARSDLFKRERILMNDWSRYLAQGMGEDAEP